MSFIPIAKLVDIPDGQKLTIRVEGIDLLICHHKQKIYVIENVCPHQKKELTEGRMRNGKIICPFHGYAFNLSDGVSSIKNANCNLTVFPSDCKDGIIRVKINLGEC
ncbi:Rieske (2Fe-2S) protein [Xenorhabdus bovienii]|uniref:Rieske (2Fe-2S) protein n=1 Tax=Xenorhabdus bovienii TaxID=40576 RepID=UPI0023B2A63F|nr:Rieske (2Fe-2S) protein [Xenorhabdus bovienii]MDE9482404.1 Rieske (2Fe-2S) protein [Xenorhabdus bovienii]MDE9556280.1 Rieske (2Fe-2S) protein [Xenorhabdus bovienii]